MQRWMLSLGSFVLIATGCSAPPAPSSGPTPIASAESELTAAERRVEEVFVFGLNLGETRSAVQRRLGTPVSQHVSMVKNLFTNDLDSAFVVRYRNGTVAYLRLQANGREFVTGIRLSGTARLPEHLRCGKSRAKDILSLLGAATAQRQVSDTAVVSYLRPGIGPDEHIEFFLVNDTLRVVHWDIYVD